MTKAFFPDSTCVDSCISDDILPGSGAATRIGLYIHPSWTWRDVEALAGEARATEKSRSI
jgi:hypothetical protein